MKASLVHVANRAIPFQRGVSKYWLIALATDMKESLVHLANCVIPVQHGCMMFLLSEAATPDAIDASASRALVAVT